jgi:alkylation response protein AidB-like acyl-CoA dehydrogenase
LTTVFLTTVFLTTAFLTTGHFAEANMDFSDSREEASFRARLRDWLKDNKPSLPASPTSDEYWAGQAAWHQALYDAGFFGMSWPAEVGGQGMPPVYEVILDEELSAAGAPARPSLGYLVLGLLRHGDEQLRERFLPGLVNGRERWCQGFSEPEAGSDLASLRTTATRDGDEYVINGHKIWTSYSDAADWCLVLARTDPAAPKHKGISAFVISMHQPGIEQRPLPMINGVTREFGEVRFGAARVPAANMVGAPGDGWRLAMTVVSHEREPGELGYVTRYAKVVNELAARVSQQPGRYTSEAVRDLGWAIVDKLLMTHTEQSVGHAALAVGGAPHAPAAGADLGTYLYSRAQSVMGGTAQIQRNLIATRILGLPAT